MTIYSPSNLESASYGQPEWVAIYNTNVERLNAVLLKINGLLDVDVEIGTLEDDAVLRWDVSRSKWRAVKYD